MNVEDVLPKDAIPSIDSPEFAGEYFGQPSDKVIVVDGPPARAYPIRILSYHEIVNDTINNEPIAVTWCPICWSGIVYDRRINNKTVTFGVSGKLADDSLVMYDRETGSEWKQTTGESIAGPLLGCTLSIRNAKMMSWDRFHQSHPSGIVLQPAKTQNTQNQPPGIVYDMEPYEQYKLSGEFGLFGMRGQGRKRLWNRTDIDAKTEVLGIKRCGKARAYPKPVIDAEDGMVTDSIGELALVVFATEDGIAAFENPGLEFTGGDGMIQADGTIWDPISGDAKDGRSLTPVIGRRMFAFAWQDAHGPDSFCTKPNSG